MKKTIESREKTIKRLTTRLQRKSLNFYVRCDAIGPRRKVSGGFTVNCIVVYTPKVRGLMGGYSERKFFVTPRRIKDITQF